jgi:hypothetical protein
MRPTLREGDAQCVFDVRRACIERGCADDDVIDDRGMRHAGRLSSAAAQALAAP